MKLFNRKYHTPGTQPGTIKTKENSVFHIDLYEFSSQHVTAHLNTDVSTCKTIIQIDNKSWIHVQGDPSLHALQSLAEDLGIHALFIEDIVNIGQRPKVDLSDDYIFVILNLPMKDEHGVHIEQVSLYLRDQTLISFATGTQDLFYAVTERLKASAGKLRSQPIDYLMYALIDTVIDFGFPLLEAYSDEIQSLESQLLKRNNQELLAEIHTLRRELLLIRKRLWPQREVIRELLRSDENRLLSETTLLHFRDCHDHVIAILEMLETFHEMTSGLMELYLTSVSLKLNDVIKFLTIFTTIFIPPTFIVGVYGMNFSRAAGALNMPELYWRYGYIAVWGLIGLLVVSMLLFFRRKKWI